MVDVDAAALATQVVPYVVTAVGAYGAAVASRVEEASADATVRVGGRVLRKIFGRREAASSAAV